MWRGETNAGSCKRTLTIYTKEMASNLACRQKWMLYYSISSECDIQINKWNSQMTHGMCLFVCCMGSVMRARMCEKSNQVCHASDGLVGGIEGVIENVML